jgi:CheY-like chemotaxis protein/putative methionine-R-sulfoxide reductase with GAF domain
MEFATEPPTAVQRMIDRQDQRVLLFADPEGLVSQWLPLFQEYGHVRSVTTIAEAQEALRSDHFDVVLSPGSELLPLTSQAGRDQARLILDGIAEGVCSVGADGKLLWANAALSTYRAETIEAVRAACADIFRELSVTPSERTARRALTVGDKLTLDITASALPATAGGLDRVVAVVSNTSRVTRLREKLDAVDAAGQELVALEADDTAHLDVPERLQILEEKLIHYCRDLLDFTHFAVRVLDPKTGRLDTVISGGFTEAANAVVVYAKPEGNGTSGYVASTGQSYICADVTKDKLYVPGLEHACSSLTVPLRLVDRIVGVLNVESDQPAKFTAEDRQFAEILGRYIAVALHLLKLLVVERGEITDQLAADVRAELAQPLNEIVSHTTRLLQNSPSPAETQLRLRAILEQVERAKQALQAVVEPGAVRGLVPESPEVRPALRGKRVLVADDEDIIRETIADVLSKMGALPTMARDGAEAITMLQAQPFDLVLSDIKMPNKNGYEVFAAARQVDAHCPVILITGFGYDPEHSIVRASREGLAGVLFKPFKVEQLLELIEKAFTPAPAP